MADENKTERVQLLMTPSEVKAIDDWSFRKRIRGRAEAMRRLCQTGLYLDEVIDSLVAKLAINKDEPMSDRAFVERLVEAATIFKFWNETSSQIEGFEVYEAASKIFAHIENPDVQKRFRHLFDEYYKRDKT